MNDDYRREEFADELKQKAAKKVKSKAKRKVKSKAKKISAVSYIIWIIALAGGIALGAFACSFICRNDGFTINGKKEYTLEVSGEGTSVTYSDKGAKVISFGRDISKQVEISTNLEGSDGDYVIDTSKEGTYYIVYTVDDVRFGDVKRVRTIRVVGGEG